jgi:hypothetical protein
VLSGITGLINTQNRRSGQLQILDPQPASAEVVMRIFRLSLTGTYDIVRVAAHRTPNAEHRMLPLRSRGWSHSTFDVRCSVFGVFQVQGPNALPFLGIEGCP